MTSPSRSPSSRTPNSPASRLQLSQIAHGASAGPAPGSVAVPVGDPSSAAPADAARVRFVRNHPTVRKIVNVLWTATNLTLANVGSWTMKEGIVFSCVSLTDHGLKLVGVDVSEYEQPYKGLAKAAEYTFSITTTMGILGVTNQYTSYMGSAGAALINQGFGFDILAGATNPGARIVQDDALIVVNLVQQWTRGSYLIERAEFGGDAVSTWFRPDDPWLAMAPDGALGAFFVGIMSQLYLQWRDRRTGGLTYPDMKAVKPLWESVKEKVLKKAGGEVNRIPAALQHELMGDWAFAVPIILVEALQAFSYSVLKDEDCPILVTAILCGFLYGYASGNRAATRNEARRTDEMTQEALEDRIKTTKPGTWARFDAIKELLKHFGQRTEGILRSRNFPLVALSLVYPAIENIVTHSMVSYSVMKYPNALEEMFPGYSPSASSLELAQRVVPGVLTGTVLITLHHFLIPSKYPVLEKPEDGKPAPAGERNAPISLAEAYTQTTQVAVGVGGVNALMHTGAEGLLVGLGMTYLSLLLTSSVLTKRASVITPDKMPPTPDLVENPERPEVPRGCGFFRGYKNYQRLREQIGNVRASMRGPRIDGPPVVIHARPVPGQLNPQVSTKAARPLSILASTGIAARDMERAMEDLRLLIWEDDDQQPLLAGYLRDFATSGATTDTEVAVRYAALMLNIQSTWSQGRSQFAQEIWAHANNDLRQLVVFEDFSTVDQRAIIRQALGPGDDVVVPGGPPGATPRPSNAAALSSSVRAEVANQLEVLTQLNADAAATRDAVGALQATFPDPGNSLGALQSDIRQFVMARNGASDASNLASYAQIWLNVQAAWEGADEDSVPAVATQIYEIAQSSLQTSPRVYETDLSPDQRDAVRATHHGDKLIPPAGVSVPLAAPLPFGTAFLPVVFGQPEFLRGAVRAFGQRGEIQAYAGHGSVRAYFQRNDRVNSPRMVVFELSADGSNVTAVRGVPAIVRADIESMVTAGLLNADVVGDIPVAAYADEPEAAPASNIASDTTQHGFGSAPQDFIHSDPESIRICLLRKGTAGSPRGPAFDTWDIHTDHLDILRDVLAGRDARYRGMSQSDLAEQLSQSFAPGDLINLLQSQCVPMGRGVMGV
jgi:hypothetical protein